MAGSDALPVAVSTNQRPVSMTAHETSGQFPIPIAYYFDFAGFEDFGEYRFDAQGIPQVDYGGATGWQYNPITVAQYGLDRLTKWARLGQASSLSEARQAADWLVAHCEEWHGGTGGWIFRFDLPFYGPKAPWISAMAQGEGISLLLRMWLLEGNEFYARSASRALGAFWLPLSQGGVVGAFPDGSPVFEEFPTTPPPHVLNGHIFALLGVYDYWQVTGEVQARGLYEEAVAGLSENLWRYDLGWWTLYDLHPTRRLASRMYQRIHVRLMDVLFKLTGQAAFRYWGARWQHYLNSPSIALRWAGAKALEKVRLRWRHG